jgi:hypothetical protein
MATSGTTTALPKITMKDLMARVLECYHDAKEKIDSIETKDMTLPAEDQEKIDEILTVTGHLRTSVEHLNICLDEIFSQGAQILNGGASRRREQDRKRKREYERKNEVMEMEIAARHGKI